MKKILLSLMLSSSFAFGAALEKKSLQLYDGIEEATQAQGVTIGKSLGEGRYGYVRVCRNTNDGEETKAIKLIRAEVLKNKKDDPKYQTCQSPDSLVGDIVSLGLKHENIVETLGFFFYNPETKKYGYSEELLPYSSSENSNLLISGLYMSYLKDYVALSTYIQSTDYMQTITILTLANQIFNGLKYLHNKKVIHRDIKAENILLDPNTKQIKICDFGFACTSQEGRRETLCGTVHYIAPEILKTMFSSHCYGEKVDIWSAGILLATLKLKTYPDFANGNNICEVTRKILEFTRAKKNFTAYQSQTNSTVCLEDDLSLCFLLDQIIEPEETKRLDAQQAIEVVKELIGLEQ